MKTIAGQVDSWSKFSLVGEKIDILVIHGSLKAFVDH